MALRWTDVREIAIQLDEAHPDADVVNLRFTDLWKWVQALPEFADDLQVHFGDRGMRIRLAPTLPDVTAAAVAGPTDRLLTRRGLTRADVRWWALHPGGRRIIDRVAEELALPAGSTDASRAVMREYGNTAAPAVMCVLGRLQDSHPLAPGEHGVALAFGPGATIWAVLLRGA